MQGLRIRADRLGWCDVFIALALIAAVVRSVIPPGFMPAMERGELALVLCTIDGARTIAAPGGATSPSEADDMMAAAHAPCAFAAVASLAPPPRAPILSLPVAIELKLVRVDQTPRALGPPVHRPQAPRAPPALLT